MFALLIGLVAYLGIMFAGDVMWLGGIASRRPDVVILTRVHPAFASALASSTNAGRGGPRRAAGGLLIRFGSPQLAQAGADAFGGVVE